MWQLKLKCLSAARFSDFFFATHKITRHKSASKLIVIVAI